MRVLCIFIALALAGCADPSNLPEDPEDGGDDTSSPADGFAPQEGRGEDSSPEASLVIELAACEAGYCLHAVATNEGTETLHVSDVCVTPFSDSMARDGEAVQHREPTAYCAAFGTKPLAPGEQVSEDFVWDATVWDSETSVPAEEGAYQWSVQFRAFQEAQGGEPIDLEATVTVVVGAT